jgi:hypothetical protein
MGIAWQNSGYNQPPHTGFYLGEDIKEQVLAGELDAPKVAYTNKPESEDKDKPKANPTPQPTPPSTPKNEPGLVNADNAAVTVERGVTEDGKNKVTVKVNKDRIK